MTNDDVDIFVEQQKAIIAKEKKKFNKQISVPKEKKIENNLFKQKVCLHLPHKLSKKWFFVYSLFKRKPSLVSVKFGLSY